MDILLFLTLFSFSLLSEIHKKNGNIDKALLVKTKELKIKEKLFGKNSFQSSMCLWEIGNFKLNINEIINFKYENFVDSETFEEIIKIYNLLLEKGLNFKEIFDKLKDLKENLEFLGNCDFVGNMATIKKDFDEFEAKMSFQKNLLFQKVINIIKLPDH